MSLLRIDFGQVADQFKDTELAYPVELKTFRQALKPVNDLMQQNPNYAGYDIAVDYQLKFLRQTCLDLQLVRTQLDQSEKDKQNELINSLQAVMEDVQNAQGDVIRVNYEDLYNLSKLSDIMREDAKVCQNELLRELGNMTASDVHDMLNKTADRFDIAQARHWAYEEVKPSVEMEAVASGQYLQAEMSHNVAGDLGLENEVAQNDAKFEQPSVV